MTYTKDSKRSKTTRQADAKTQRRLEAEERQTRYDTGPEETKLNRLDQLLGLGVGAKKQRARLTQAIADRPQTRAK